jgi:death-on-curing protein
MISLKEVRGIHKILIDNFGGSHGIRDLSALESALVHPYQTFDGKELYETTLQKAAALLESILINHVFIDGNKRTGYTLLRLYLLNNNIDIKATQDEKYNFIIAVASGQLHLKQINEWLASHTYNLSES